MGLCCFNYQLKKVGYLYVIEKVGYFEASQNC